MQIFSSVPRIISGLGCVDALGDEVKKMGCEKALIVCDWELEALGLVTPLADSLNQAGVNHVVFSDVQPDPGLDLLDRSRAVTNDFAADLVIGLGGGSPLDVAKLISIMLTNKGPADTYYGINNIPEPGLPMILIPTTAGTGSEVTNISVMEDPKVGLKKAMIRDHLYARVALLDPNLTLDLPPHLTATTGMDALVHASEADTTCPTAWPPPLFSPGSWNSTALPTRKNLSILQRPLVKTLKTCPIMRRPFCRSKP